MESRKRSKSKLTPPDTERCQAEVKSFMTLGPGRNRCDNVPIVIAKERKPGKDGQRGSMSLCRECLEVFKRKMGNEYADFKEIPCQQG